MDQMTEERLAAANARLGKSHTMPTLTNRQQVDAALAFLPPEKHQQLLLPVFAMLAVDDKLDQVIAALRSLEAAVKAPRGYQKKAAKTEPVTP